MSLEAGNRTRQLTINDIEPGKEFTLAAPTFISRTVGSDFKLRVGDVIIIHTCDTEGFAISVNGHFKAKKDRLRVSLEEVSFFTIVDDEE